MNFRSSLYFSNLVSIAFAWGILTLYIYLYDFGRGSPPTFKTRDTTIYINMALYKGYMMRGIPLLNMQTPLTCQQKFLQDLSSKLLS